MKLYKIYVNKHGSFLPIGIAGSQAQAREIKKGVLEGANGVELSISKSDVVIEDYEVASGKAGLIASHNQILYEIWPVLASLEKTS